MRVKSVSLEATKVMKESEMANERRERGACAWGLGRWVELEQGDRPLEGGRRSKSVAAPLPLTSFADDVAALDRTLERIDGPVVLVGHAYAGAVIAATAQREGAKRWSILRRLRRMKAKPSPTCSIAPSRIRRRRSWRRMITG